jgi:hypothetical protein
MIYMALQLIFMILLHAFSFVHIPWYFIIMISLFPILAILSIGSLLSLSILAIINLVKVNVKGKI